MVDSVEDWCGYRKDVRHQNSIFYADDGRVALLDPRWRQEAFSTMVGLFDRVGLKNNFSKTVRMVCRPCQAAGTQSE